MKRTPLARRTELKRSDTLKRKPIKRRPPGKRARSREFSPDVKAHVWARAGGRCEAAASHLCRGTVEHYHHRLMRSRGGGGEIENCLGVCGPCHSHIHRHPTDSYAAGWLIRGS